MQHCRAIVLSRYGDPSELILRDVSLRQPGPRELLIRQTAIGVNFHDVYVRSGLYSTLSLPGIPGIEAVGRVESVGAEVSAFRVGDRIGYVSADYGAYAEMRVLDATAAIKLPPGLSDVQAAATLMKALTACVLVRLAHVVKPGEWILVQAAAGGVGQLLSNWASYAGATVIGTVGSAAKARVAQQAGVAHTIRYDEEAFADRVLDLTGGRGVAAVYDSVGNTTFLESLRCLDYFGTLVNFGQSSGAVQPFSPNLLSARSLSIIRPVIFHYLKDPQQSACLAEAMFAALAGGVIKPIQPLEMDLADAAEAHRVIESRRSPGGVVLIPRH
jgi:NADPH2:quinone reductase